MYYPPADFNMMNQQQHYYQYYYAGGHQHHQPEMSMAASAMVQPTAAVAPVLTNMVDENLKQHVVDEQQQKVESGKEF